MIGISIILYFKVEIFQNSVVFEIKGLCFFCFFIEVQKLAVYRNEFLIQILIELSSHFFVDECVIDQVQKFCLLCKQEILDVIRTILFYFVE